jgi:sulfotransferase
MKPFVMLSGLPRTGSQVLASILNQHPDFHASTTSPVVDLLENAISTWRASSGSIVNEHYDRETNILRGLIAGAYEHVTAPIIIDKNRLWPRKTAMMTKILGARPKIIMTVRPIPEILASYVTLIARNSPRITFIDQDLIDSNTPINTRTRCAVLWNKYMSGPYDGLRIGLNDTGLDKLILSYDDIVTHPQQTMNRVSEFLGVTSVEVETNNLIPMPENDIFHGGLEGLHEVRKELGRISDLPENIIGHELTKLYTDMKLDIW